MSSYNKREANTTRSAFIIIDMENGFIDPASPLCIAGAAATVPALASAIEAAREKGIPVFYVKRIYRPDGSDVENTRYECWRSVANVLAPGSAGPCSIEDPAALAPRPEDYIIIKPRFSAFFQTELDLILRRLGVRNIILTGTTTPNCIRTTAYDGISLDYNVIALEDCCSSQTPEIQRANIEDMARIGVTVMTSEEFIASYDADSVPDISEKIRADIYL